MRKTGSHCGVSTERLPSVGLRQYIESSCLQPLAAIAKALPVLFFRDRREPCGSGFTREAGNAEAGTGFARVRG